MATLKHKSAATAQAGDSFEACQLAKGLTLVPYWRMKDGIRISSCKWVRLCPGETLSDAAHRLTLCALEQ